MNRFSKVTSARFESGINLRRIVNNTVISLTGQLVTWISTLLLTIAYGRFLGDFKFGELYFAITFVLLIGFPIEFGFNQQLTRDVSQEPARARSYLSNTLVIKAMLWLVLYAGILCACWLLGYNAEERILVAICGVTLLGDSLANAFASLHFAFERVIFPAVGTILEKGLAALVGFLLLRNGASVEVMALILLGGAFVNACWQAFWFFNRVGVGFTIDGSLIRHLLRSSIPFLTYGVLGVIYYRLDTIILSLEASAAVVGWYGAAYRLFDTLIFLPSLVISAIMYPVFSKLSVSSEASLKTAVEKTTNFLLFCVIPTASLLMVAAPSIIAFLYHRQDFTPSVPALQGLAPGLVFLYINSVFSAIIMSTKQEKKITIMAAVALVFNLALNLFLIPLYQHVGAAIVTSLTELLLLGMGLIIVPNRLLPLRSLRVAAKALTASMVMAVAIFFVQAHIFNIFVVLTVGMLVYFGVALPLGTIPAEDLRALFYSIRHKGYSDVANQPEDRQDAEQEQDLATAD
jgi:O-antigen/teichoic acid export membrane protein